MQKLGESFYCNFYDRPAAQGAVGKFSHNLQCDFNCEKLAFTNWNYEPLQREFLGAVLLLKL